MDARTLSKRLIEKGLLSEELAQKLIMESKTTGQSFEDIIHIRQLVDDSYIAITKSELLKVPYRKVESNSIKEEVLKIIPEATARSYKIIPLDWGGKVVVIGMVDPDNTKAQEALKFLAQQSKVSLGVYVISMSDFEMAIRRYNPFDREIQEALQMLKIKPSGERKSTLDEVKASGEEAPIIKIVASTLKEAISQKASDIHIEPERTKMRVRFRVDGDLKEVAIFPLELLAPIVSRIKVLSNLKIDETRVPQDGRFRTTVFNRDIDYRVATFPTPSGEKMVIRVLDSSTGLKSIDQLGILGRNAEWILEALEKPFGMILVTGPTGSGKTTTLYSFLQTLNTEEVNILSMEDPVEYFIEGVNQSQVRPEIGYTFAAGLRQALRQDPDIILVGEIRDKETAELAVQAALTGHVVLSTLHTNNAAGVIPRLLDMGVAQFLLPSSLNIMIAQRLVSKLCTKCRQSSPASEEVTKMIDDELNKLDSKLRGSIPYKKPYNVWHSPGCDACKGKGISGRIAIYEVMKMTREIEDVIANNLTEWALRDEGVKQGMVSMRQDGIFKALAGMVAIEEVLRETAET